MRINFTEEKAFWLRGLIALGIVAALFTIGGDKEQEGLQGPVAGKGTTENRETVPEYTIPYPEGRTEMNVSSGEPGPKPSKMIADPFAPKKGEMQTWRIKAAYEEPIDSIEMTLQLDSGEYPETLKLAEGTATDGWWEGTWNMPDSTEHRYAAVILLKSGKATTKVTPVFRDITRTIF